MNAGSASQMDSRSIFAGKQPDDQHVQGLSATGRQALYAGNKN